VITRRTTLAEPTDDGEVLSRAAFDLLARADLREPVRLIGVGATNLVGRAGEQLSFFAAREDAARRSRLNQALDELARRFGAEAVVRGGPADTERAGLPHQIKRGGDS
jgi:DNA polymerase-4